MDLSRRTTPLTPTLETFAELSGLDMCRPLSEPERAFVVDALAKHVVLLVRGQELSQEDHARFAASLGATASQHHSWAAGAATSAMHQDGHAIYFTHGAGFANQAAHDPASLWGGVDRNHSPKGFSCWHTDDTDKIDVARVSILCGLDAPERGGATLYADTQTAYETLEPEMRARLDGLRVVHFFAFPGAPMPVSQPLVKTNGVTGRKSLYLNFNSMDRIEGLAKDESNALLAKLFHHATRPELVYRHVWRKGDCILWNNVGSMHRREAMVEGEKRVLRRFQVEIPELLRTPAGERTRPLEQRLEPWSAYPFAQGA